MGSLVDKLYPLISRLGMAGSCILFTLLAVVVSLALTFTVMTLAGVQGHAGFWIKLAIFGPLLVAPPFTYVLLKLIEQLNQANVWLQQAQAQVKGLNRLVPVCFCCKKIRDDKAYWDILEEYISLNHGNEVPHGICPHCKEEQFKVFIEQDGNV